ncbi:Uncharacterised protein [Vibrio cholerae]|nr:Uncharacterised protein [Vibrio cholerae]
MVHFTLRTHSNHLNGKTITRIHCDLFGARRSNGDGRLSLWTHLDYFFLAVRRHFYNVLFNVLLRNAVCHTIFGNDRLLNSGN